MAMFFDFSSEWSIPYSTDFYSKKMKTNLLLILSSSVLFLSACSSTPTKVDSGTVHARTFSFVQRGPKPYPAFVDKRQPVHDMIQEAITKNLSARGISKVASDSDITVAYLVIIGNNASTTSVRDYFGYGRDTSEIEEKAYSAYNATETPNYFEAGTLLIDLIDSKSFKLLKRGYATRPALRNVSEQARAETIQGAVDEILRDLRLEP
jgi:hypothetical protein